MDVLPDAGAVDVVDVPDPPASVVGSPPGAGAPLGARSPVVPPFRKGVRPRSSRVEVDRSGGPHRPPGRLPRSTGRRIRIHRGEPSPPDRWTAASAEPVVPERRRRSEPAPTMRRPPWPARGWPVPPWPPRVVDVHGAPEPDRVAGRRSGSRSRSESPAGSRSDPASPSRSGPGSGSGGSRVHGRLTQAYGNLPNAEVQAETVAGRVVIRFAVAVPDQLRRIALAEVAVFVQAEGVPMPAVPHTSGLHDEHELRVILQ